MVNSCNQDKGKLLSGEKVAVYPNANQKINKAEVKSLKYYLGANLSKYQKRIITLQDENQEIAIFRGKDPLVYEMAAKQKITKLTMGNGLKEAHCRVAINKNPFYYFNVLKEFFPHLMSVRDFLYKENYLNIH